MSKEKDKGMSNFLEQWVMLDRKPITARLLSIVKRCHISVAHQNMAIFYDEMIKRDQNSTPFTTWIIKGLLKAQEVPVHDSQISNDSMEVDEDDSGKNLIKREALLLVTQDKLKETEAKFESVSVKQIYSFSPPLSANHTDAHKIAAISHLTTIQHELHSSKEYTDTWESTGRGAELGTIQPAEKWGDSGQPKLLQNGASSSKLSAAAPILKKEPVKEVKKEEKIVTGNTVKKADGLKFDKAKVKVATSKSKSKRKLVDSDEEEDASAKEGDKMDYDNEEDDDDDDAGPIGYSTEASKAGEAIKGGKAVRKRADAGDKMTTEEEKKRKQKQELIDMMDEDEAGNADPPSIEMGDTASTSMMKGTVGNGIDDSKKVDEKEITTGSKRRIRKQRKVIKKVKTKDSKGYTKTQDVEEYESYSSDESDTPAIAPKSAPSKTAAQQKEAPAVTKTNSSTSASSTNVASKKGASTGGAGGSGGQRKLASFFTKKK